MINVDPLLTSREVASLLGVSASSVKRWAEEGRLACIKTVGKHRRFERAAIDRFLAQQVGSTSLADDARASEWIVALLAADEPRSLEARLLDERGRLGSWWRVADSLGPVVFALGDRWAAGELGILEEHLASDRLSRALARVCEWLPVASHAPRAVLATAEGDPHTLGLSLVEVCLRELGWRTLWAGRDTPTDELARKVASLSPPARLLAVSASAASSDGRALARQVGRLGEACRSANIALLVGGSGHWPDRLPYGTRLRSLEGLVAFARPLTDAT